MAKFKKTPFYPLILLFSLGLTWGTSFSFARFAMKSGVTTLGYQFWQTVGPACLLSFIVFFTQKRSFSIQWNQILFYVFTGLFGILLPNYFQFVSALHMPSGILGLIVNTSPIITYLLSLLFAVEKFKLQRFFGVFLGFCGLYLLFAPRASIAHAHLTWVLFAFLAPCLLALCTIFIVKFKPPETNSLELACGMLIAAAILVAPLTLFRGEFHPMTTLTLPNVVILLEIGLSSLGFILFFELLRISGPVYYSLVSCLVALASFGWGYLMFHETLGGTEVIAILFTILAIYLVGSTS